MRKGDGKNCFDFFFVQKHQELLVFHSFQAIREGKGKSIKFLEIFKCFEIVMQNELFFSSSSCQEPSELSNFLHTDYWISLYTFVMCLDIFLCEQNRVHGPFIVSDVLKLVWILNFFDIAIREMKLIPFESLIFHCLRYSLVLS